jgi:hypothetical protein
MEKKLFSNFGIETVPFLVVGKIYGLTWNNWVGER